MNSLPEDVKNTIYYYKHQLEFCMVLEELLDGIYYYCGWCGQGYRSFPHCMCEKSGWSDTEYDSDHSFYIVYELDRDY